MAHRRGRGRGHPTPSRPGGCFSSTPRNPVRTQGRSSEVAAEGVGTPEGKDNRPIDPPTPRSFITSTVIVTPLSW